MALGVASTRFLMEKNPATTNGTHTAIHPKAQGFGSMPSDMCIAEAGIVSTAVTAATTEKK